MKFSIYTLGCKVNQYESEALAKRISELGHQVEFGLTDADVYILNTCAVTNEAEHKSREVVAKINKINPNAKIYVCGCSSELHPEKFLTRDNVRAVVGTESKNKLIELIEGDCVGQFNEPICNERYNDIYNIDGNRIRSFIKIQDGCNNFCSYCIIPFTRGRERSRTVESTLNEIERVSQVSKEIVLVGINMAGYGKDLNPRGTLSSLVDEIALRFPEQRLRFSSFEMGTISIELLESLKRHPNFCPFFHLSLQSGSDEVLKMMNRHYTFDEFMETVDLIRKYFPNAGIGTDIIVGFPTESEEDFNNCLKNVEKAKFSLVHAFPYSRREGTLASKFPIINGEVIKKRLKKLNSVTEVYASEFIKSQKGKTAQVLVEENVDGMYIGFTENYIKCYINSDKNIINKVVNVRLGEPFKKGIKGELVNE